MNSLNRMDYRNKANDNIARVINKYRKYKYPLHKALETKDEEAVRIMINDMKNPNVVDGDGNNALHMAAWHGCSVPVFGRILDKIKDVNAGNNQNRTAITIALAEKHLDLVESLLKVEDIDVNISDNVTGKNALHWASTRLCSPYLYKQILETKLIMAVQYPCPSVFSPAPSWVLAPCARHGYPLDVFN